MMTVAEGSWLRAGGSRSGAAGSRRELAAAAGPGSPPGQGPPQQQQSASATFPLFDKGRSPGCEKQSRHEYCARGPSIALGDSHGGLILPPWRRGGW